MVPILIGTYTRLSHLKQTISALQENYYSEETDLYIASDFPKDPMDSGAVDSLREYVESITGFLSVNKIYREENYGASRNFTEAAKYVLEKHDSIIMLEDDIVTGRGFLKYMNDALGLYRQDDRIFAVSGYLWPTVNSPLRNEVLVLQGYCAWGWGTWREKFFKIQLGQALSQEFFSDIRLFYRMCRINPNLLPMVLASAKGQLKAWDVDVCLNLLKYDKYVVFPGYSLVRNVGFDGTGINCGFDDFYAKQDINLNQFVEVKEVSIDNIKNNSRVLFNASGGWVNLCRVMGYVFIKALPFGVFEKLRFIKNSVKRIYKIYCS